MQTALSERIFVVQFFFLNKYFNSNYIEFDSIRWYGHLESEKRRTGARIELEPQTSFSGRPGPRYSLFTAQADRLDCRFVVQFELRVASLVGSGRLFSPPVGCQQVHVHNRMRFGLLNVKVLFHAFTSDASITFTITSILVNLKLLITK